MEVACACIFVLEIVVKTCVLGPCVYFCGPACHWNLFDVFLSSLAILEAFFSAVLGEGFHGASHSRAAMVLRCFRIARMARLAKLLRMPLMEELATIISGLAYGRCFGSRWHFSQWFTSSRLHCARHWKPLQHRSLEIRRCPCSCSSPRIFVRS